MCYVSVLPPHLFLRLVIVLLEDSHEYGKDAELRQGQAVLRQKCDVPKGCHSESGKSQFIEGASCSCESVQLFTLLIIVS